MQEVETIETPPRETNAQGDLRRVGVEIEFANLSAIDSADIIQDLFGGHQEKSSEHQIAVKETRLGDFKVELDWQGAHKHGKSETVSSFDLEAEARAVAGRTASILVPTEIICPPIPWNALDQLDTIYERLRDAGAEGTEAGILYSFGLHLNPEVAEETADYALRHLQAYVVLEDWLREQIDIDWTRKVLPHIDPFPPAYLSKILDVDYAPDLQTLIKDYVLANQTRNRGLDMTPLFRHLDEATLIQCMDDTALVKARPTFHYRLPDATFSKPGGGPVQEWNRWLVVERLAADTERLHERMTEFGEWLARPLHERWIERIQRWFE